MFDSENDRTAPDAAQNLPKGLIDFHGLEERVPLSERSLRAAIAKGYVPVIRLPGARRQLFCWASVQKALKRFEEGGFNE